MKLLVTPQLAALLRSAQDDASLPQVSAWSAPLAAADPERRSKATHQAAVPFLHPTALPQDLRAAAAEAAGGGAGTSVGWDTVKALAQHARQRDGDAAPSLEQVGAAWSAAAMPEALAPPAAETERHLVAFRICFPSSHTPHAPCRPLPPTAVRRRRHRLLGAARTGRQAGGAAGSAG